MLSIKILNLKEIIQLGPVIIIDFIFSIRRDKFLSKFVLDA